MDINYYEVRSADLPSMLITSGVPVFSSVPYLYRFDVANIHIIFESTTV